MCCIDLAAQSRAIVIAANSRFDAAMADLTRRRDACRAFDHQITRR